MFFIIICVNILVYSPPSGHSALYSWIIMYIHLCSVVFNFLRPHKLCSLWGSSVHGIFQTRILEWVAVSFSSLHLRWGEVAQSCPTLCNPIDCSLPGSSVHGIFQARVLEWGAIAFSVFRTSRHLLFGLISLWEKALLLSEFPVRQPSHVDGIKPSVFFCPQVFSFSIMGDSFFKTDLFIWLCWVLVAACGIF